MHHSVPDAFRDLRPVKIRISVRDDLVPEVLPAGIALLNQIELPVPAIAFDLPFPQRCCFEVLEDCKIDQLTNIVAFRMPVDGTGAMFPDPFDEV